MRYLRIAIFFLLIVFSTNAIASECKVTILHFNDFHGNLETPKKGWGGGERIAAIVAKIDQENLQNGRHTILLNGGDLISGTPVSDKFKGEVEYKFFEKIGGEAMVIGNHDFDFGIETLKNNMKNTDVPVLSANIIDKSTGRLFTNATYVFPLGPECRVGVMGLTLQGTPQVTGTDVSGLTFQNPIKVAGDYIDDLVDQSEIRVALTHLGVNQDVQLAKSVKGFNVVVGGHDHVRPNEYCKTAGGIPVCQTPAKGEYVGRIDLAVNDGKVVVEKTELIPVDKKAGKSKEMRNFLQPYFNKIAAQMGEVVSTVSTDLYHRPKSGLVAKTPLGEVAADAMKSYVKADAAFMNTGGLRKTIKRGAVTRGDIFEALPFQNYVGILSLSGGDILQLIDLSEKKATPEHVGPYLVWAGLDYKKNDGTYDVSLNGKPLESNKIYKVATVDFIANGGDGYTMLKSKEFRTSGKILRDVVEKYMKSHNI